MTSLNLQLREPGDDYFADQIFDIAKPALESGEEYLIQSAAQKIALLLPEQDPNLVRRITFDYMCADMAEQIPFNHERMRGVVALLEAVHGSPRFAVDEMSYPSPIKGRPQDLKWRYFGLSKTLSECWSSLWSHADDAEEVAKWASFHAFVAHLEHRGIVSPASLAVQTLRDVFENHPDPWKTNVRLREDLALAAAQHIHITGHALLRQILHEPTEYNEWYAGSLFKETRGDPRSLDRWRFWQKGFRAVVDGQYHGLGRKRVSPENKEFIGQVADSMTAIEEEVGSAKA